MAVFRRRRGHPILSASAAPPSTGAGFILLEDGYYLLMESGDRFRLEADFSFILLETGDFLLAESGDKFLTEDS